ncbi:MAG: thioredoxin [Bdellovibrionota bacterium]
MKTYTVCTGCGQVNRVPMVAQKGQAPVCGKCKSALPVHGAVSELSASELNTLSAKSPLPVVVDFWAPWCGPCKVFSPVFEEASRVLGDQFVFVKVDTQANPLAGDAFHIRGIPTLLVLKGGVEKARQSGAMPRELFVSWLKQVA